MRETWLGSSTYEKDLGGLQVEHQPVVQFCSKNKPLHYQENRVMKLDAIFHFILY